MDFSQDMADEILKIFQVESEEIITKLSNNLLLLEKNPNDKDAILLLFRDAHSLKGASRMVGFTNVQTVAHKMEDILGLAKEDKLQIHTDVINLLYKTIDFISDLIHKSIETGKEIYTDEISKQLSMLEGIENMPEVVNANEQPIQFNSVILTKNINTINNLIADILFTLMSFELNQNPDLIKKLLEQITKAYEIFKEIKHFEIKNSLEDIKVKLEFTTKASNELTSSEIDDIQQKIDDIISKLIPMSELYNLNLVDYYSIAFDKTSKGEDVFAPKEYHFETEQQEMPLPPVPTPETTYPTEPAIVTGPQIDVQPIENKEQDITPEPFEQKSEEIETNCQTELDAVKTLIQNLSQGASSIEEIKSSIMNYNSICQNQDVKNITEKIRIIFEFASSNAINLDEESLSVVIQSLEHCDKVLQNNADMTNQELFLQRLTIIQQLLEIGKTQAEDKKFVSKSGYKLKNKISDFSSIYNTGDIKTLRVDSAKLDTLINQVNELTVTKIKTQKHLHELKEVNKELEEWQKTATRAINYLKYYDKKYFQSSSTETPISFFINQLLTLFNENNKKVQSAAINISNLHRTIQEDDAKMNVVIDNLGNMVKEVRVLPLATVFHLFGRMVRDIAQEKNKKIDLEIFGSETSTDKKIIEEIKTPLIHIIRNSIDHGIETPEERIALGKPETGKITLSAQQSGNKVIIKIQDDGRGINVPKIKEKALEKGYLTQDEINTMSDEQITNLIFAPGFSTGDQITNISGRGIGLDVVQSKIAQLNGKVKIISETNIGCCVQIELPTSMSTIKAFLVKSANQTFAIPMEAINTVLRKNIEEIMYHKGKKSIIFKEKNVQLQNLSEILNLKETSKEKTKEIILILETDNKMMAISVDKLIGDQEILQKKLSAPLYKLKNISGLTTLASGETCLILNISDVLKTADGLRKKAIGTKTKTIDATHNYRILLVDDSITTRTLEKNILLKAGYNIDVAENPIEAFEKLKTERFNLIISDIEMPEMNGLEFLEKLKTDENYAEIPVIMVSSLISEDYKKRASELGAEKYIIKGEFEQDDFQDTIKNILSKSN